MTGSLWHCITAGVCTGVLCHDPNLSYHTYSGCQGLLNIAQKHVYITEYGLSLEKGYGLTPAAVLHDLWQAERQGKFDHPLWLSYAQLTDNADNHGAFNSRVMEGNHFAFADFILSQTSTSAGLLLWNITPNAYRQQVRHVPGMNLQPMAGWHLVHIAHAQANSATLFDYLQQSMLDVRVHRWGSEVLIRRLPAQHALFLTNTPVSHLVN